jgi:class 3 adenylate cyclase
MDSAMEEKDVQIRALSEENERLRVELKRLHMGVNCTTMTMGASAVAGRRISANGTVVGVEELILQVNPDGTIGYINMPMAILLGVPDRRSVLGQLLADWDNGPLGKGTLRSMVDAALVAQETVVVEKVCTTLDESLLPKPQGTRPVCDPVLRFAANSVKGRVEIVAQDITRVRWLENTFARYVAPEVIEQMLMRPEENFMEMDRRNVTVLFADLRGFTRITQQLEPHVLQEMVNQFLSNTVDSIKKFGGTVDKFIGDEVMALFGAPVPLPDHPVRAMCAAIDAQNKHNKTIQTWEQLKRPTVGMGIGLTTGDAFIGNLGTLSRMEYTAIGHTVNLAARLCGAAGSGEILTTEECFRRTAEALQNSELSNIPRFKFSPKGKQTFKNVDQPVTVLSVSTV